MSLFDLERKLNSKNPKKMSDRDKLYNECMNLDEQLVEQTKTNEQLERERRISESNALGESMVYSRSALRRKLIAEKVRYENLMKENLFKEAVYDIFMESLLLDDDFKDLYSENLREMCYSTLDDLMKEHNVTLKSLGESSSVFVQNIVSLCEDTAKDEADKLFDVLKVNDPKAAKETILNEKNKRAKLDEEGKKEFTLAKELETKSIAEAVKEKVVNVVRAEQELADMDNMERDELDMETEDPADIDARSEQELADREMRMANEDPTMGEESINDDSEDFSLPDINESAKLPINRIRKQNKLQEESLFRSLQLNIASKAMREQSLSESGKVNIDMDLVLAEALSYYTLLESLHTARIIEFKPSEVRSLAKELVFRTNSPEKK